MIDARFAALAIWPYDHTPLEQRRSRWTFKAGWQNTLELLDRELRLLEAADIVIGVNMRPQDIRQDGWPRANALQPAHPGVEVSFNSGAIAQLDPVVRRGLELIRLAGGNAAAARKRHHPDAGGTHTDFIAVQAATDPTKRLVYATDVCDLWQHNVRSVALGLEALRAVDRYGISRRGEQYAGFRAALTTRSRADA